jgi:preprotein translocase subunit SecG
MSMLAEMSWGQWALGSLLVFTCFILMLVILLQKGRGGGFSGAFGGAGGSSAFGAKTGDVFTWITVVVAGVFAGLTVWGNFVFDESLKPKITTNAVAEPIRLDLPAEGLDGIQPGQPARAELEFVDPTTGEKSTIVIPGTPSTPPGEAVPTGQPYDASNARPAEGSRPLPSAVDESARPAKDLPPEGEKRDESENRPNP